MVGYTVWRFSALVVECRHSLTTNTKKTTHVKNDDAWYVVQWLVLEALYLQ